MLPILPSAPSRADPANFSAEADAWVAALENWTTAANNLELSLQANNLIGTSTTSLSVGTGSKGFTTQAGKVWLVGSYLYIVASTDITKVMQGKITSYNSTTGALVVDVNIASGSGTFSSWNIGSSNPGLGGTSDIAVSNNLGLGLNPYSWSTGIKSVDIGLGCSLSYSSGGVSLFASNTYIDVSSNYVRKLIGYGVMYQQTISDGSHVFYTAATGSAGSIISSWLPILKLDASGNVLSVGNGGIGYGVGAGGSVTQSTSKSTGVTLNKVSGQITMNASALASNTSVTFLVSNTSVLGNDNIIVNLKGGYATYGTYDVKAEGIAAGSFVITLKNISGGSLSEAVILSFSVIRGSTT